MSVKHPSKGAEKAMIADNVARAQDEHVKHTLGFLICGGRNHRIHLRWALTVS